MKNLSKLSAFGMMGGALIVSDNLFNDSGSAFAQSTLSNQEKAASLASILNYLLDGLSNDDYYVTDKNTILNVNSAIGVLSNDQQIDGATLNIIDSVENGTLKYNNDGSFQYAPNVEFVGFDSFTYEVIRPSGSNSSAKVTIRVNASPEANDDAFDFTETPFSGNVIFNTVGGDDVIVDNAEVVEVVNETTALGGTISIQANGAFQYSPPSNLGTQVDSFVYTLVDDDGDSDTTTISWRLVPYITDLSSPQTVAENATLQANFTLVSPGDIEYVEVNGSQFSLAQLNASSSAAPLSVNSEVYGQFEIIGFSNTTGMLSYRYDPTSTFQDHSGAVNDQLSEVLTIKLKDTALNFIAESNLTIHVTDTNPTANDDSRTMSEGSGPIAGNTVGVSGAATGDVADQLIDVNPTPVTDVDFGSIDGTPGANLSGAYGYFNISNVGVYTYTLDNSSPSVQGLKAGESLTETFRYTITDGDGDTDEANVSITINGLEDAPPAINFVGANTISPASDFLYSVAENTGFSSSYTLNIDADAGYNPSGTVLSITPQGGSAVDLTLIDINSLNSTNQVIDGSIGTLTLNGVSNSGGTINFNYSVPGVPTSYDHTSNDPAEDFFTVVITDNEGDSDTKTVEFEVTDTAPTAAPDTATIQEDSSPNPVTGDVMTNDTTGADTAISVSKIDFGGQQVVGTPFPSQYGTIDINSDGTYTYTLDNTNPTVDALDTGYPLVETFNYTIVDTDGDESSNSLTVTIWGTTDPL